MGALRIGSEIVTPVLMAGEIEQVQANWSESDPTSKAYILNKPTIGDGATTITVNSTAVGTITANQTTSGAIDLPIPSVTSTYSASGTDAVNGVAVSSALGSYQLIAQNMESLSASGTIVLSDNTVNKITATGSVTFTLPTVTDLTRFHQMFVQLYMGTVQTINLGVTGSRYLGEEPSMDETGVYNIYYEYDNNEGYWYVGVMKKGGTSSTPVEQTFVRPNLSSDGTLGGSSFAVYATGSYSGVYPYQAVDGDTSTNWRTTTQGDYFVFYNPDPLKVTQIVLNQYTATSSFWAYTGSVYGSDDNANWTLITSWNQTTETVTIDMTTNNNYYKYYKLVPATYKVNNYWGLKELLISATYIGSAS